MEGVAGWLMRLTQAFEKGLERLFRHLEKSKLKPGEIDYSMAEIFDTPYRMMCPSCHQACWSFERHIRNNDKFDNGCEVHNFYSNAVYPKSEGVS